MSIKERVEAILSMDDPNNYEDADCAIESIVEEFEDLTDSEHYEVCEIVEEWFVRGFDEECADVDDETEYEEDEDEDEEEEESGEDEEESDEDDRRFFDRIEKTVTFPEFRLKIAKIFRESKKLKSNWVKRHLSLIEEVDYEGEGLSEIYNAFRCYEDEMSHAPCEFEEWLRESTSLIHDAIIDAHHGICPIDISTEVEDILDDHFC